MRLASLKACCWSKCLSHSPQLYLPRLPLQMRKLSLRTSVNLVKVTQPAILCGGIQIQVCVAPSCFFPLAVLVLHSGFFEWMGRREKKSLTELRNSGGGEAVGAGEMLFGVQLYVMLWCRLTSGHRQTPNHRYVAGCQYSF